MIDIKLKYNPFNVNIDLSVKEGEEWIPVEEKSGLMRISNMRMQRWLDPSLGYTYLDDLREAVGDDEITIRFSGTAEDLLDLKNAAMRYCKTHSDSNITVKGSESTERNSSSYKLKQLSSILDEVKKSNFQSLLPDQTLTYLEECLNPKISSIVLMPLSDFHKREETVFAESAWQMIGLYFSESEILVRKNRLLLREFSQRLNTLGNRSFERERFLFLCTGREVGETQKSVIHRLLMEYGIEDMNVVVVTMDDLDALISNGKVSDEEGAQKAVQAIELYKYRYADQYRLRKLHDVLNETMRAEGYTRGTRLLRRVDEVLRGENGKNKALTDKTVRHAAEWVARFYDNIERLIDIAD